MTQRLIFLLSVAHRRLQRHIEARAGGTGVTAARSGVLFALEGRDGASVGEIAASLDMAPSAMTGLADRMVASGLIEKRADLRDARSARLFLTPAGRAALGGLRAELARLNAQLTDGLSPREIEIVAGWLESFRTRFPPA